MKPDPTVTNAWEKLAAARRAAVAANPAETDDTAPFGFAQHIVSRTMALQRHRQLGWWTRWSLRTAGAATVAAALVALARTPDSSGTALLAAPSLEIPGFSSL